MAWRFVCEKQIYSGQTTASKTIYNRMSQIMERNGCADGENESGRCVGDQVQIMYDADYPKVHLRHRRHKSSKYERKHGYVVGITQKMSKWQWEINALRI